MKKELKTSQEWKSILCPHTRILDPDGWDRLNYEYSFFKELITKEEFMNRLTVSTTEIDLIKLEKLLN